MNRQRRRKPEEIIGLLRECEVSGQSQEAFCRERQTSQATLHRWRKRDGQMSESDAKRLKELEKEWSAAT